MQDTYREFSLCQTQQKIYFGFGKEVIQEYVWQGVYWRTILLILTFTPYTHHPPYWIPRVLFFPNK